VRNLAQCRHVELSLTLHPSDLNSGVAFWLADMAIAMTRRLVHQWIALSLRIDGELSHRIHRLVPSSSRPTLRLLWIFLG
jgi:hypothetical protein